MSTQASEREPLQGVTQIVCYNWPFYVFGGVAVGLGIVALRLLPLPVWLTPWGWLGVALAAWWLLASLAASWWVYDASPLCRWEWVRELFPEAPARWANLHAGLDESTHALRRLFPHSDGLPLDFYDAETMTEPSIRRARALTPPPEPAAPVSADDLPLPDDALDAVFLFFAAHELRRPGERQRLFREVARVLRPGGRVVLAEHLRDGANFAAFGPGFLHFWPRSEWRRLADMAGLRVTDEQRITPFVGVFVLEKGPS